MNSEKKLKVVIVGGGSAGWMTAAALTKLLGKNLDVTLIESEEIGRIGVGEATIPPLRVFNQLLGIKEQEFMQSCQATFKLGIDFYNWGRQGDRYLHSFGETGKSCWAGEFQHFWLAGQAKGANDSFGQYNNEHQAARAGRFAINAQTPLNYAYHLDAGLYAKFLKTFSLKHGLNFIEGKIVDVGQDSESGDIKHVVLENGEQISGDFFVDCSGFRAILIDKTLDIGFDSYQQYLPSDSAIAVPSTNEGPLNPYTQSIAHQFGWQWRIPLQHRTGNGLVFCSEFGSDEQAIETITANIKGEMLMTPKVIKYDTGRRLKGWDKNCVCIGLSSGFLEPVESTAIHLIMSAVLRLMRLMPKFGDCSAEREEYNHQSRHEMETIRDFIILHYKANQRDDAPFWQHCANMPVTDSLQHRLDLFNQSARICIQDSELFRVDSWAQVMLGQNIKPQSWHPIADMMADSELSRFLHSLKSMVDKNVSNLPEHAAFIEQYCPAPKISDATMTINV